MAQLENKECNLETNLTQNTNYLNSTGTFGFYQWCNFGKWKGYTFYDIANEHDFKYLKWIVYTQQNPKIDPKTGKTFRMSTESMQHIHCALRTEVDGGTWKQEYKPVFMRNNVEDHDSSLLVYTTEKGLVSPTILYQKCIQCQIFKNNQMFKSCNGICTTCNNPPPNYNNNRVEGQRSSYIQSKTHSLPVLPETHSYTSHTNQSKINNNASINPNDFMDLFKKFVPAEEVEKMQFIKQ